MRSKDKAPTHAGAVYLLLAELWPKNGYAILPEVGNSTGARTNRHADAVVMSLWPSRGLDIYGVEIKVSRSDWLSELRNPEKADAIAQYCDGWYVAVSRADIIQTGELPKTWGLIACDTGKAKITKPAPTLEAKAPDRGFIAAMLRRASEFHAPETWLADQRESIRVKADESARAGYQSQIDYHAKTIESLRADISRFQTLSGVDIQGYGADANATAFKKLRRALDEGDVSLSHLADRYERAAVLLREAIAEIKTNPIAADVA